jgi:hypothetical protein
MYDLAALKYWGSCCVLNFPVSSDFGVQLLSLFQYINIFVAKFLNF